MDDLERVVKDTAAAIDRHVMTTMLDKHRLAAHCSAIKRYLLLGQVQQPFDCHSASPARPSTPVTVLLLPTHCWCCRRR